MMSLKWHHLCEHTSLSRFWLQSKPHWHEPHDRGPYPNRYFGNAGDWEPHCLIRPQWQNMTLPLIHKGFLLQPKTKGSSLSNRYYSNANLCDLSVKSRVTFLVCCQEWHCLYVPLIEKGNTLIFVLIMPASWFFSNRPVQPPPPKKDYSNIFTEVVICLLDKPYFAWIILWNLASSSCYYNSLLSSLSSQQRPRRNRWVKFSYQPQVVRADMQGPLLKKQFSPISSFEK